MAKVGAKNVKVPPCTIGNLNNYLCILHEFNNYIYREKYLSTNLEKYHELVKLL